MIRISELAIRCLIILALVRFVDSSAIGADEFEQPPIEYSASAPNNGISQLQAAVEKKPESLKHESRYGYLRDLLEKLKITPESQILVFSKTSLQRSRISPRTPRAIYFNDDVYIGYCHNGDEIETAVADPQLGAVFYTVDQKKEKQSALVRQTQRCLQCHGTEQTDDIPGFLMRSVYVDTGGVPILSEGGHYINDTTPMRDRWGGWYVTGKLNGQNRLGNLVVHNQNAPKPWTNETAPDLADLDQQISADNYLTPRSDAVALLVFAHQIYVHNLITKANYTARQALSYQAMFNRALEQPANQPLESVTHRIEGAGDKLVEGLLFVSETPIEKPIRGAGSFAKKFVEQGPRDKQGRSLREFDLDIRLFKYPCSYLIYSRTFDGLPSVMKTYVAKRLDEILAGGGGEKYAHLSACDRQAISEILHETKAELWKTATRDSKAADGRR